jgi:hypothetical protein
MASSRPALTETPQRITKPHWGRPVNSEPRPCLFDVGFPLSGLQDRTHTSDLNVRAQHTRRRSTSSGSTTTASGLSSLPAGDRLAGYREHPVAITARTQGTLCGHVSLRPLSVGVDGVTN